MTTQSYGWNPQRLQHSQNNNNNNNNAYDDPTIWQPGFDLPRLIWYAGPGLCAANLHKWSLAFSDKYGRGTVHKCPVSKLHDGGLQRLYCADDVAVNWLEGMAMKEIAK